MITQQTGSKIEKLRTDSWFATQKRFFIESKSGEEQSANADGITYKVVGSVKERVAAFRLVHHSYTRAGLMEPNRYRMRVTPYHLLATTDVFIAIYRGRVICTLSLIGDGELGIPMEVIYREEISKLRDEGRYFAEVSCLASRQKDFPHGAPVLVDLIGLMLQYARHNGLDQVLLAVHPRHERYYSRVFGCKRIGDVKSYPSVLDNLAVACSHDFDRLDVERYPLYDRVYGTAYPPRKLQRRPMLEPERQHFRPVTELCGSYVPTAAI